MISYDSTTTLAPEFLTQKRSPALLVYMIPRMWPVKGYITNNAVVFRRIGSGFRRINNQLCTAEPLSKIVVGIAFQFQCYPLGIKCAKALTCRAIEIKVYGIIR
jgi:hypothetical protein